MPDAVNCCSRRCHAKDFRGSVGRAPSRLLENGMKSVSPRGYQGGQEWLWWAHTAKEQRCWAHKTANVLNKMPNALQANAKSGLHQIWLAETRDAATKAFDH
jgi:hypothetical protein